MENVIPAGAKRLGYKSDISPVVILLRGMVLARKFIKTITINETVV